VDLIRIRPGRCVTVVYWSKLDWERLYKVLRVAAAVAVRGAPESFDLGVSAEDLVQETLSAFFGSSNGLGWAPEKGPIEKFLAGVLWNKARDHLRRHKKVGGSLEEEGGRISHPAIVGCQDRDCIFNDLREKLYAAVDGDQDLKDLIAAAELTTGAHNVNQELAELLGKTPPEVVNLKRRLMNHPRVKEILYGTR
jgi:DNA-directed RNA polymerase specialized sigma24 family protein